MNCFMVKSQQPPYLLSEKNHQNKATKSIDLKDTVIFNMAKARLVGTQFIDIPVSIKSDEDVFSLDFSLQFNPDHLLYDSILDITGNIQMTDYYNPIDATLRFTSNSFKQYPKDTIKLIYIRFKFFQDKLQIDDLHSVMAYLNGENCSTLITEPDTLISNTNNMMGKKIFAKMYPNPASDIISVEVPENAFIEVYDGYGRTILFNYCIYANQKLDIDIQNWIKGNYLVKIFNENIVSTRKLIKM